MEDLGSPLYPTRAASGPDDMVVHGGAGGDNEWGDPDWRPPANLDAFFGSVYAYFAAGGFRALVVGRLLNLLTLAFTVLFSTFLFVYVDWAALYDCHDEASCGRVVGLRRDALSSPSAGEVVVFVYFAVFSLYWLWNALSFVYEARAATEMRALYRRLGIDERELPTLEWFAVVDRLVALQDEVPLCLVKKLTALDITNRIMRKDNYLVAIINAGVVDTRLLVCVSEASRRRAATTTYVPMEDVGEDDDGNDDPARGGGGGSPPDAAKYPHQEFYSRRQQPRRQRRGRGGSAGAAAAAALAEGGDPLASVWSAFGRNMEWNLRFCIMHSMFDAQFRVRRGFVSEAGVRALQRRFFWMGVLNLLLMPFIMIFMVVFFLLRYAEEFRSKKDMLGRREWSPLARLRMRELNELSHHFRERLAGTHEPATRYVLQFPSTVTSAVAEFVAYVSGAFVAVMLLLAFVDSAILINIEVAERALIWWLTIFTIVLAVSRSLVTDRNAAFRPNETMERVVEFTHYMPRHWWGRCHTFQVHDEFESLYATKMVMLVREVLSVVMTPFVMCFTLPRCAGQVVEFVRTSTVNVDGVGDVCAHALFDLDEGGGGGGDNDPRPRPPRARGGKMEKSLLTFAINNPTWQPEASGSRFIQSLMTGGRRVPTADVLGMDEIGEEEEVDDEVGSDEKVADHEVKDGGGGEEEDGDGEPRRDTSHNLLMGSFSELLRAMPGQASAEQAPPPPAAAHAATATAAAQRIANSSHLFSALERSAHFEPR